MNRVNFTSQLYILLSFMGLIGLLILIWIEPSENVIVVEKSYTSLLFIIICLLGMLAVIYPSGCRRILGGNKNKGFESNFKGHHPDCGKFNDHVLAYHGKCYCAGCAGLFLGAFTAILLVIMNNVRQIMDDPLYLYIGVLLVLLSFSYLFFLKIENRWMKLLSNYFLVIGSAFLFISIAEDMFISAYLLVLILIWVLTRICTSEENHKIKCKDCTGYGNCEYHYV